MAAKRKPLALSEDAKKPIAEVREDYQRVLDELEKYKNSMRCPMCGKIKLMSSANFYAATDPSNQTGFIPYCKDCIKKIAHRVDKNGNEHGVTKASVMKALQYLDKPFLNSVWDSSYFESQNGVRNRTDIWGNYIKNIQMINYAGMRWEDGDAYAGNVSIGIMDAALSSDQEQAEFEKQKQREEDEMTESESNRAFVVESIGYDPFIDYPRNNEKPRLYGQMANFIDDEAKDDPMKMAAIIEIVKTYNQIEHINKNLDEYVCDPTSIAKNAAMIDKLSATKDKLNRGALALAKDNGLSVNNNNNKSKGANTLSGKIKQLNEIGFRDASINTFDYETCEGMRQVAELSEAARHKQIGYDDNIAQEIKDIKVELVETLTKERDAALESMRLLLVENIDLKAALKERGAL